MAHNLSWIDPDVLRSLVSETAYRQTHPEPARAFVPSGGNFVVPSQAQSAPPPAAPQPRPMSVPPLRSSGSVRRASRPSLPNPDSPTLPAAPPVRASILEPFMPEPGRTLEARLEQLMGWACKVTGLARVFIADCDGLLVASLGTGTTAVEEAASVVDMCARSMPRDVSDSDAGTVTMVAGERTHVVAWDLTRHGKTFIALSGTVAPTSEALSHLSRALRDALR